MAKKTKGRVGRRPIHRLAIMGNIDGAGRVIAAVPLFQPGQPYPLGLSVQRLHGIGETGVVVRMVGADGNMASMVVNAGKDPATVATGFTNPGGSVMVDTGDPVPDPRFDGVARNGGDRSGPQPSDDPSQEEIDAHDQRMMQVEGGE